MTTREEAAEQLRSIRKMMERAQVFRALSGETALIGGALALAAAWLSENRLGWEWVNLWLGGLLVVLLFNAWQLWRASAARGKPFWSGGLRLALRGALPSIIAGGFIGVLAGRSGVEGGELTGAMFWMLHYGLALLALREFAPRSMVWLGWAFVIFAILCFAGKTGLVSWLMLWIAPLNASQLMGISFGGFHLVYGALIVTTTRRGEDA